MFGLCKTRTGSFAIRLVDESGGVVDQNPHIREAFERAAARYTALFRGAQTVLSGDLIMEIKYSVEQMDGPYGVLGRAGPTFVYGVGSDGYGIRWFAGMGMMMFDIDDFLREDIAPLVESIILHEMAHALGFGVLWEASALFSPPFPGTYDMTDCIKSGGVDGRYNSLDGFARTAYRWAKGYIPTGLPSGFTRSRLPPIETDVRVAQCAHWDDATLGNELMTGVINPNSPNPLSIVTGGAFEDLGFVVDYGVCDHYEVPFNASVLSSARAPQGFRVDENMTRPTIGHAAPGQRLAEGAALEHTQEEIRKFRLEIAAKSGGAPPQ